MLPVSRYGGVDKITGLMNETSTAPRANRLLGLEALRFVAALAVLIWHYKHFACRRHATGFRQSPASILQPA